MATTTERLQVGGGHTVVNKLPAEILLVFPFNLIGKSTMVFLTDQSWRVLKSWNTARISADGPSQGLVSSVAQAIAT